MLAIQVPTRMRRVAAPMSCAVAMTSLFTSAAKIASKPASSASRAIVWISVVRQPIPGMTASPSRSAMGVSFPIVRVSCSWTGAGRPLGRFASGGGEDAARHQRRRVLRARRVDRGPGGVGGPRVGVGGDGPVDQLTGQREIPGRRQLLRPGDAPPDAAGQPRDLVAELGLAPRL